MLGSGDAAGFGQPSIQHLWREFNGCVLGKLGMERNEHLLRLKSAVEDFLKRSKSDYNINHEQVEMANDLMAEITRYIPQVQPSGGFPEEDQYAA